MSEGDSNTHTHLCAKCQQQFECGKTTCEKFHYSICNNCAPPDIQDPDAPSTEQPINEEDGDEWTN